MRVQVRRLSGVKMHSEDDNEKDTLHLIDSLMNDSESKISNVEPEKMAKKRTACLKGKRHKKRRRTSLWTV